MIDLGNIQNLTEEKFYASLDGLPYVNNSGVYDAVIIDAIVGNRRSDPNHKIITLGLMCTDSEGKRGRMTLNIDVSDTEFKYHTTNLAYIVGSVDQTGRVFIDDQKRTLPKPLPDGRTYITVVPAFTNKSIKVAVRRSTKTNPNGIPYFSVVAFFNAQGQSAIEIARSQQPQKIHEALSSLQSEGNEMIVVEKKQTQGNVYGQAPAYGQQTPSLNPQQQSQNIYGQAAQQYNNGVAQF